MAAPPPDLLTDSVPAAPTGLADGGFPGGLPGGRAPDPGGVAGRATGLTAMGFSAGGRRNPLRGKKAGTPAVGTTERGLISAEQPAAVTVHAAKKHVGGMWEERHVGGEACGRRGMWEERHVGGGEACGRRRGMWEEERHVGGEACGRRRGMWEEERHFRASLPRFSLNRPHPPLPLPLFSSSAPSSPPSPCPIGPPLPCAPPARPGVCQLVSYGQLATALKEAAGSTDQKKRQQLVALVFPKLAVYNSVDPSLATALLLLLQGSSDVVVLRYCYYFLARILTESANAGSYNEGGGVPTPNWDTLADVSADGSQAATRAELLSLILSRLATEASTPDVAVHARRMAALKALACAPMAHQDAYAALVRIILAILDSVTEDRKKRRRWRELLRRGAKAKDAALRGNLFGAALSALRRLPLDPASDAFVERVVLGIGCGDAVGLRHALSMAADIALVNPLALATSISRLAGGSLAAAIRAPDMFARVYLARLCAALVHASQIYDRADFRGLFSAFLFQLLYDANVRVCLEAICCITATFSAKVEPTTAQRADGWQILTTSLMDTRGAARDLAGGKAGGSKEKEAMPLPPSYDLVLKVVAHRVDYALRSTSRPMLHAALRAVAEVGKARAAALSLGLFTEAPQLPQDDAADFQQAMGKQAAPKEKVTVDSLLAALMEAVRCTVACECVYVRAQALKAMIWMQSEYESSAELKATLLGELDDPAWPAALLNDLLLTLHARFKATPDMAVTILDLASLFVTRVPSKVDTTTLQALWKVLPLAPSLISPPRSLSPLPLPAPSPRSLSPLPLPAPSPRSLSPLPLPAPSTRSLSPLPRPALSPRSLSPLSLFAPSPRSLSSLPLLAPPHRSLPSFFSPPVPVPLSFKHLCINPGRALNVSGGLWSTGQASGAGGRQHRARPASPAPRPSCPPLTALLLSAPRPSHTRAPPSPFSASPTPLYAPHLLLHLFAHPHSIRSLSFPIYSLHIFPLYVPRLLPVLCAPSLAPLPFSLLCACHLPPQCSFHIAFLFAPTTPPTPLEIPAFPFLSCPSPSCPALPLLVLPFPFLSCPSPSCPALPLLVLPFPFLSCPSPSCPALPLLVLPFPFLSCPSPSCPALPLLVLPFPFLSCPSPSCPALPLLIWFLGENANFAAGEYAWESATPPGAALMLLDAESMVAAAGVRNPTLAQAMQRLQRTATTGAWEDRVVAVYALMTVALRSGEPYRLQIYEFFHALFYGGGSSRKVRGMALGVSNGEDRGASGTGLGGIIAPMLRVLDEMYRCQDVMMRDIRLHEFSGEEWQEEQLERIYDMHERLMDLALLFCFVPRHKYLPLGPMSARLTAQYRARRGMEAGVGRSEAELRATLEGLLRHTGSAPKDAAVFPPLTLLEPLADFPTAGALKVTDMLGGGGDESLSVPATPRRYEGMASAFDAVAGDTGMGSTFDDVYASSLLEADDDAESEVSDGSASPTPSTTAEAFGNIRNWDEESLSGDKGASGASAGQSAAQAGRGRGGEEEEDEGYDYEAELRRRAGDSGAKQRGRALYAFIAGDEDELSLSVGEEVEIEYEADGWYHARKVNPAPDGKQAGFVPVLYLDTR
ncbi:unnamed protein product [Closterium sp. NIES-64]|nr:unnamed protein product [Closterium sp. NIES-64]